MTVSSPIATQGVTTPTLHSASSAARQNQCDPQREVNAVAQDQWVRDLETLKRIEEQALYPDPCFFCAMAEIQNRGRAG